MRSWIWRISAVMTLICGLATSGFALSADPLTPAQFRDAYVAEVQRQIPSAKVKVISETEVRIIARPGEEEQIAYLDNAYRRYRADPSTLEDLLRRHAGLSSKATTEGPLITPANAMVVVRHMDMLRDQEALRSKAPRKDGRPQSPLVYRPLPGDMAMVIVSDQPEAYLYVSEEDVVEAMGSINAAWAQATANTEGLIGEAEGDEVGAIVVLTTKHGSASSLLVVDDFWERVGKSGLSAPVVLLVDRNTVAMAFENNADSLRDLKLVARGLVEEPGEFDEPMVSSSLLIRRNGKWVLYADYPYR